MKIELIHFDGCPNIDAARENLRAALKGLGLTPKWKEYGEGGPGLPAYARGFGSPTILIDGVDIAGVASASPDAACRVYERADGTLSGVPPVELIRAAISGVGAGQSSSFGLARLAVVPGIGVALLPKLACPACWPAYAGFLSALGLGFLIEAKWLLPLTAVFLVLAVAALGYKARARRGFGPLALGVAASALVLVGKFVWDIDRVMYAGIATLVAASLWNTWPRKATHGSSCPIPHAHPSGG
ncbi:MerC family mercury resistance protein [bacterium]|nr:MerC family mercury resistance protein [bacterium]